MDQAHTIENLASELMTIATRMGYKFQNSLQCHRQH